MQNRAAIISHDNPLIRKLMALSSARGIRKHGVYLAGGTRLVREALLNHSDMVKAVIAMTDGNLPVPAHQAVPRHLLSPALFKAVNVFGAPEPLLLMHLPELPVFDQDAPWPDGCTLVVPFGDPENVGVAIRSAAALGVARVALTAEAACPFLPRALRAAAGTVWRAPLLRAGFLNKLIWPDHLKIFTLDAGGRSLEGMPRPQGAWGLIAGQEGPGLPENLRGRADCVAVPMHCGVESLNAATATAIVLWEWRVAPEKSVVVQNAS